MFRDISNAFNALSSVLACRGKAHVAILAHDVDQPKCLYVPHTWILTTSNLTTISRRQLVVNELSS